MLKEILVGARELIATPGQWTQGVYHRKVGEKDCYCLAGAILCSGDNLGALQEEIVAAQWLVRRQIRSRCGHERIVDFNDKHTYEEVISVLEACL